MVESSIAKRDSARSVFVLVLVIAALGLAALLLWETVFPPGEMPVYARAADDDALLFIESSANFDDWIDRAAESRFVDQSVASDLRRVLQSQIREKGKRWQPEKLLTGQESLPGCVRMAYFSTDVEYDTNDPFEIDDMETVTVLEFESDDYLMDAAERLGTDERISLRKLTSRRILIVGTTPGGVRRGAGRIEDEEKVEGTLAGADHMAVAAKVNEGDGMFLCFDLREMWRRALRQVGNAGGRTGRLVGSSTFDDLAAALGDLLPKDGIKGAGAYCGVDSATAVVEIEGSPFLESGFFDEGKGDDLLELLPADTPFFLRMSLFASSTSSFLDSMEGASEALADILDDVRAQISEESRGKIDVKKAEKLIHALAGNLTGGFVYAMVGAGAENSRAMVMLVGLEDRDDALETVEDLLNTLGQDEELPRGEVAGCTTFRLDRQSLLAFHDRAAILYFSDRYSRRDGDRAGIEEIFEDYLDRCSEHPLADKEGLETAFTGDVEEDATFVFALHPYAIGKVNTSPPSYYPLHPVDEDGGERPRERSFLRGPLPQDSAAPEGWVQGQWIGVSVEVDDGLRLEANAGYADLLAIVGLTELTRALYRERCLDAIDQTALRKVLREIRDAGGSTRSFWGLQNQMDEESFRALLEVDADVDDAGNLIIENPLTGEKIVIPGE